MVLTSDVEASIISGVLNDLDNYGFGALGTGGTSFGAGQTTLQGTEVSRKTVFSTVKNIGAGTYDVQVQFLSPSDLDGNTVREFGLFDANSGGNMAIRQLPIVNAFGQEQARITLRITVSVN